MTSPADRRGGRIVTFYSYKGGTGRTMALANVAWILASAGKKVLVADWDLEAPGLHRFFHPFLQQEYEAEGLPSPRVNPRWWKFTSTVPELSRPTDDAERYRRLATPFPLDRPVPGSAAPLRQRLAEDGRVADGNWLGVLPIGPFPRVEPGRSVTVTFAFVAALNSPIAIANVVPPAPSDRPRMRLISASPTRRTASSSRTRQPPHATATPSA